MYLKSDVLLLADFFKNFRKMCLKINELNPSKFISAPGLAWQAALKKKEIKLELLNDVDTFLMVESRKELEVEYVMQLIGMQKVIINI